MITDRVLVFPWLVPIRILSLLHRVGLHRVEQVHAAISVGNLQLYKGIGPVTEAQILELYTVARDLPVCTGIQEDIEYMLEATNAKS